MVSLNAGSERELMLVFELKLIEELKLLTLEQLADVKHFKQLRLEFQPLRHASTPTT